MPLTANTQGYWYDSMLDKYMNQTDPQPVRDKLVVGQIDPSNASTIPGGAPMLPLNHPDKPNADLLWMMELQHYANKAGFNWNTRRNQY